LPPMKKKYIQWLILPGLALVHQNSYGQSTEQDLDPVTITASIAPEKQSRTGRNILVVKGERFQQLPVHSLDELLRYLPGIEVQARGPMGSQADIVLRGGTFQQVLILIDGLRVNDPNTGHFSGYIPIAPQEIDRIEILKGASSALYGSEAVGGVIHVITKTFAAKNNNTGETSLSGQFTAGAFGLYSGNAGGVYKKGRTAVSGGILTNNARGQQQRGTTGFFNNHTASVSVNHFLTDKLQLSYRTAFDDRDFSAQNFYTSFISDTARERVRSIWNQLQLSHHSANNTMRFGVGYKDLDDKYFFNSVASPNHNKSRLWQSFFANDHKLGEATILTAGFQYLNKSIRSNDRGDHDLNQAGAFVILNQQLGDNFFLNPAMRMEYNQRSGWEAVPQLNASYRLEKIVFRASAGKTIRDADFTERFNNYNKSIVNSGRIGNPDLEAERSFSYEAGVDFFASGAFKLSAGYFNRNQSRLIDYVVTPYAQMPRKDNLNPAGSFALARNIAEVRTSGAELDIIYQKTFAKDRELWASFGFVWLNSKTSDGIPSLYISTHAKYLVNYNLRYVFNVFAISINGIYKQRQPQKASSPAIAVISRDYVVINTRLEAMLLKKTLNVFVQADNVLDRNYADLLGSQMPGRWIMGGIKISLSK
jgi:vitamin B12 transporter